MRYEVYVSSPVVMAVVEKDPKFSATARAIFGPYKSLTAALVKLNKAADYLGAKLMWQTYKPHEKFVTFVNDKNETLMKMFMTCYKTS